jgi:hypothetical protein
MNWACAGTVVAAVLLAGCAVDLPKPLPPKVVKADAQTVFVASPGDPNNVRPAHALAQAECEKHGKFARLNSARSDRIPGEMVFDCVGL